MSQENLYSPSYYEILGVDRKATPRVIKKQYHKLAIKYHPDKLFNIKDNQKKKFEEHFKEITTAYKILFNKDSRLKYDAQLKKKEREKNEKDFSFFGIPVSTFESTDGLGIGSPTDKNNSKKKNINKNSYYNGIPDGQYNIRKNNSLISKLINKIMNKQPIIALLIRDYLKINKEFGAIQYTGESFYNFYRDHFQYIYNLDLANKELYIKIMKDLKNFNKENNYIKGKDIIISLYSNIKDLYKKKSWS